MTQSGHSSDASASEAAAHPRYVVDPKVSRFTIQAFSGGILSALGHNPSFVARDFEGEVTFDSAAPNNASLTMAMRTTSLALVDDVSERDRDTILRTMHDDVLESSTFPEIVYRCQKASPRTVGPGQFGVVLDGTLTLHGVTRDQAISARFSASEVMLRAFGEFTVRQTDYDIKLVAIAAMLKVKDELKCSFDIVARRTLAATADNAG